MPRASRSGCSTFSPVGVPLAIVGVVYITFLGWKFIPKERRGQRPPQDLFEIANYVVEVKVPKGSKSVGKEVEELEKTSEGEVTAVSLIRRRKRLPGTPRHEMHRRRRHLVVGGGSGTTSTS